MNYVIDHMRAKGLPMTLSVYLALNGAGSFKDLGPEDTAEVYDLLADGTLRLDSVGAEYAMITKKLFGIDHTKEIQTMDDITEDTIEFIKTLSEEEKRTIRESMIWDLYDKRLTNTIH
jgi:hypothetical protein